MWHGWAKTRVQFWAPARGGEEEAEGDSGLRGEGDGMSMFYVGKEGTERGWYVCEKIRCTASVEANEMAAIGAPSSRARWRRELSKSDGEGEWERTAFFSPTYSGSPPHHPSLPLLRLRAQGAYLPSHLHLSPSTRQYRPYAQRTCPLCPHPSPLGDESHFLLP